MDRSQGSPLTVDGVRWTIKDPSAAWVPSFVTPYMSRLSEMPGARLVKQNMVRTVVFAAPPSAPMGIYIKSHRCLHFTERLKHLLRPSKAAQEWAMARALAEAGVASIRPIAYAERRRAGLLSECCLVSEALPEAEPLWALLIRSIPASEWHIRQQTLNDVALMMRRMHQANILHDDLHVGNVLYQCGAGGLKTYLLDLHPARKVWRLSWRARRRNLVRLMASLMPLTSVQERHELLLTYAKDDAALERLIGLQERQIERTAEAHLARQRRVRTGRCLRRSSEFDIQRIDGAKVYFRREFPPDLIRRALTLHRATVAAGGDQVIKRHTRGCITTVCVEKDGVPLKLCVKESAPYGWKEGMEALLRGPESRRIWLASHGLRIRGIAACELLAAGESKRAGLLSQVFVIMKALEHFLPLQVYVYRKTSSLKGRENALFRRGLARSVGRLLASLHEKKIFHADLKASNIMVNERGPQDWEFVLIDLDRVRFDKDLDLNRRARNLRQLESDLWPFITTTDRLRCFRAYGEAARLGDWRRVWQIIQWPLKR